MGSCAGCGGPNRRAENYKVNRLTQDSPMKSSITPSELPIRKHKERVIDDLNETKKRIDSNNLINTLLNSSVMYNEPVSSQGVRSSSKWGSPGYQKQSFQGLNRDSSEIVVSSFQLGGRRGESRYGDENNRFIEVGKSLERSNFQNRFSMQSKLPITSNLRQANDGRKAPLSQVLTNKNTQFSRNIKQNKLLNIPELPEEEAKTPNYVIELRKENGEDVRRSGLEGIPKKIESAPSANLFRYLKDLQ